MSAEMARALGALGWWIASIVIVFGPWIVKAAVLWRRRSQIRIRVRRLDSPAARAARHQRAVQDLDAGCQRLLAAIPAQRTGGEHRAG